MRVKGLLTASVLRPKALRELLLYLAQAEFYDPRWSPQIIDEMRQGILAEDPRRNAHQIDRIIAAMRELFPDADVFDDNEVIAGRITTNTQYRHVVAAAYFDSVDCIVTLRRDFPVLDCSRLGIAVRTPDQVACRCVHDDPVLVCQLLTEQAARLSNPLKASVEVAELLGALEPQVPRFATIVSQHFGIVPSVKRSDIEHPVERWNLDENLGDRNPDSRGPEGDL